MLKVVMNGAIESLSIVSGLPEAMHILFPAVGNPNVCGCIEDMETGEVLVTVENGDVTYIAPATMMEMMDDIFEADPMMEMLDDIFDADPLMGIKLIAEMLDIVD